MDNNLYKIVILEHEKDFYYCLYETQTELAYDFYLFEEEAVKQGEFLSNGGAFHGFTPKFMLNKVVFPKKSSHVNNA